MFSSPCLYNSNISFPRQMFLSLSGVFFFLFSYEESNVGIFDEQGMYSKPNITTHVVTDFLKNNTIHFLSHRLK